MKVLDLGAHDGFVSNWLARRASDEGVGLTVDGVEANSHAVTVANARSERDGIAGRYVQGLAEDAPEHFEPGTYDAVVAFELIEHVPDVEYFLHICEGMCNESGRVYLSTPDGTFGEGNNPHHLRAYRSVDLYELCRRHGRVENMLVGFDGVTVISYTPFGNGPKTWKSEVAIYCGPGWEKWHPQDIETKGLGGSETAAVRLAVALSDLGYTVTVYGECDFCAWKQVQFKPHHTFDPLEKRRAVISSRRPDLVDRPVNSESVLLWMHDTDYGQAITQERIDKFNSVMVLSHWHASHVEWMYKHIEFKDITITGNAIEPAYFDKPASHERPPVAVYSSSPDRGLDLMLKLWPKVREQIPDAELHYCYASVYDKVAEQNPEVGAFREKCRALAGDGTVNMGSLTQPQLAKKMLESRVWLAPSYNTLHDVPFHETYCIGALEAAAAGCAIVASGWGALPERVEDAANSVLIPPPEVDDPIREDEWVSAIVNSMLMCEPQISLTALATTWEMRAREFDMAIRSGVQTS